MNWNRKMSIFFRCFPREALKRCTGCPKKNALSWFLAITPLWKGLEIKVGGAQKFRSWLFRSWENWVHKWQPYLKNLDKNGGNFFWIELNFCLLIHYSFLLFIAWAGIPHDIQNVDFIVQHKFLYFLRYGCQLLTQFSQLLIGQIAKFLCLSDITYKISWISTLLLFLALFKVKLEP